MASNVTVQSVLGKISQDHLECSICSDRFKEPKVLDCLHSFCLKCLQQLRKGPKQDTTGLICPLCRRETPMQGNDVANLPNNFTMSALVEEVTMQEQLLEGQRSEITCQNCDEGNEAISRCSDCDSFFCQECQRAHGRMAAMKTHELYTLDQLQSGEIAYKSKLRDVPRCKKHPDQNLNIYCNTCEKLVCTTCFVLHHAKHSLIDLPEALGKCKQEIAELTAKVEKNKADWREATEEVEKTRKTLDTMYVDTNRKISETADKEIAKIREEEQRLKQEAEKIYKDRVKRLDTALATNREVMTQAEHKLDEVHKLVAQSSCHEILDLKKKLLHNLSRTELTSNRLEKLPTRLAFLDFKEGERPLGHLLLEGKPKFGFKAQAMQPPAPEKLCQTGRWQLKTKIKEFGRNNRKFGCARDIATFSNNEIVVVDTDHHQLISIFPRHPQSPIISQARHTKHLNPSHVTVNKHDQLIVLHSPLVKVFNNKYHLLHYFKPGTELGSSYLPTCIAVDSDNLIAVGYETKEVISLHKPNGSLIRKLPAPMIKDYLTIYKQQFVYTNWKERRLVSVDYSGHMVFSVNNKSDGGQGVGPDGVCYDSNGSLYVPAYRDKPPDEIHQYSLDGKYIGCAIKECDAAYTMTFTTDGDLVVAAGESVKIYHRP